MKLDPATRRIVILEQMNDHLRARIKEMRKEIRALKNYIRTQLSK